MGDNEEAANMVGVTFGPHKRLFVAELVSLKEEFKSVDAAPLLARQSSSSPSPSPSPTSRPHTDRAKQAVHRRKKSKSPVNRIGSFQSIDSIKDDLSVASGLEDSVSVASQDGKERMRNLNRKGKGSGGGKEGRVGRARPFSKGAARGVKQPPRLNLTIDVGGGEEVGRQGKLELELDSVGGDSSEAYQRKVLERLERSYELSDGGTFYAGGFGINARGIKEVPINGRENVIQEEDGGETEGGDEGGEGEGEYERNVREVRKGEGRR